MKKSIIIIAAILMAGFSTKVMAQNTKTVAATVATTQILAPLGLTQTSILNFGKLTTSASSGSCELTTAGANVSGGLFNYPSSPTNAAYNVTGEKNKAYTITLPTTITVSNGTPLQDMTISALTARCLSTAADGIVGTIDATSGTDSFKVGGTLTVAANQPAAVYTGSFDVTVAYN